jgi:hypothetical protein
LARARRRGGDRRGVQRARARGTVIRRLCGCTPDRRHVPAARDGRRA